MLLRDGMYLLRTNLTETNPNIIWQRYILLTQVEAAFKSLKSSLAVRPMRHQLEHRVKAHIFVAVMGYCLMVTLRHKLSGFAGKIFHFLFKNFHCKFNSFLYNHFLDPFQFA